MVKKKTTKKKSTERKPLTAHGLLGALSYWGTAARLLLAGTLIAFAFMLNVSYDSSWSSLDAEIILLIYGIGVILMLDTGYVMAARALPVNKVLDRWVVMMSDLLIAGFFVAPSLLVIGTAGTKLRVLSLILALLVLSVRILLGLLYAKRKA